LTDDDLVINRGLQQGVGANMVFDIIDPRSVDIKDPITNELLGSINRIKAQVRVTEVGDLLSMARIVPERESALSAAARIVGGVPKSSRLTGDAWPEGVEESDPVGFDGRYWSPDTRTIAYPGPTRALPRTSPPAPPKG
jgi:hypothetical protein